jgi:hypothetical protein
VTDTRWADVSEHQPPVDDSYPHPVLAFRSNDGTYHDKVCGQNLAWAKAAADSGRLACFLVYLVYYPNWQDGVAALQAQVGTPHPGMVVMIDVESWGGTITGDQSAGINSQRDAIAAWLGDSRRVIAYGNKGDLRSLYPNRPADLELVVASYGSPPDVGFPGFVAQQYTDQEQCSPFGPCDMNVAPGLSPTDLAARLGVGAAPDMDATDKKVAADTLLTVQNAAQIASDVRNLVLDPDRGILHQLGVLQGVVAGLTAALGQVGAAPGSPVDLAAVTAAAHAGAQSGISGLHLAAVQP